MKSEDTKAESDAVDHLQHHQKVTFNFCHTQPSKAFIDDILSTNQLSEKQYEDLILLVFNFLKQKSSLSELNYILQQYSDDHCMKLNQIKQIFKSFLIISQEASRLKLSLGQLYSDLQKLGQTAGNASKFCQLWQSHADNADVVVPTNIDTVKKLVDMEWKFGVTAASSEINRVGQCFIQMKLIVSKNASETETIFVEMSLSEFYDFLHEMEKAKLKMDSIYRSPSS